MKKATLQDIANSLGISRTTVWKVFSGHEGVSDTMKEKILSKARELNYKGSIDAVSPEESPEAPLLNIAVAVCRPESSVFWLNIIHQIAKELSLHHANLIYTYLPSRAEEDYELPASLTGGHIDGIIVVNVYQEHMVRLLSRLDRPKVFLDTVTAIGPGELNGDLVLPESNSSVAQITEHLVAQGHRRFGFIGDISYALSNHQRYEGFMQILNRHALQAEDAFLLTRIQDTDACLQEIDAFLDTLPCFPDVFVCVNDYLAGLTIQLLQKRNLRVPEDVAVSGFDDIKENSFSERLTTVQVFSEDVGRRLALQILFRITYPEASNEIVYVSTEVIYRNTTAD